VPGVKAWRVPLGGVPHTLAGGRIIYKENPMKGFPDICGLFSDGRMFAFEVKGQKPQFTQKQREWHAILKGMNCICHVVYSLDDVIDIVSSYFDGSYDLKVKDQYD
jgi:hypothetical protein